MVWEWGENTDQQHEHTSQSKAVLNIPALQFCLADNQTNHNNNSPLCSVICTNRKEPLIVLSGYRIKVDSPLQ